MVPSPTYPVGHGPHVYKSFGDGEFVQTTFGKHGLDEQAASPLILFVNRSIN